MELQTGRRVREIKSDGGGEFDNRRLREWLEARGAILSITVPYKPQQNGMAERHVGWLHNGVRVVLKQSRLPVRFWAWALRYVTWTKNRLVR